MTTTTKTRKPSAIRAQMESWREEADRRGQLLAAAEAKIAELEARILKGHELVRQLRGQSHPAQPAERKLIRTYTDRQGRSFDVFRDHKAIDTHVPRQ